ncbi:MAG: hypothetical protein DWQ07_13080 [Chloroflexi bacterium]|nr:MAG: hypothetical protein DWQ07_13080 [Chloroflexota bacterium]MBL1196974.1 hypothetical protein [Chloroflexota bacterium]
METWENLFVEDNFGRVWLASDEEALIFEDGEFTHFLLPHSLNFVQDIAVDPEREFIYFLGSKSITYRSTSYNP